MDIGGNIRKARKIRGLTQIDVAEMAEIAVNSLRLYEAGKRTPNLEQLQHIARAIGVEWPSLVDGDFIWDDGTTVEIPAGMEFTASLGGTVKATVRTKIDAALDKLNPDGQQKAVERVEELTEIPRYRAETPPESTLAPQEGKDTTPPPDAPETPPEGE